MGFGILGSRSVVPTIGEHAKSPAEDFPDDNSNLDISSLYGIPTVEFPIHLFDRLSEQVDRSKAKGSPKVATKTTGSVHNIYRGISTLLRTT